MFQFSSITEFGKDSGIDPIEFSYLTLFAELVGPHQAFPSWGLAISMELVGRGAPNAVDPGGPGESAEQQSAGDEAA